MELMTGAEPREPREVKALEPPVPDPGGRGSISVDDGAGGWTEVAKLHKMVLKNVDWEKVRSACYCMGKGCVICTPPQVV
jgi:hypothetical protein